MRWLMKVLQIKRVVPDLVDGVPMKLALAHFELKNEDNSLDDENDIDSSTEPRQHKLEENIPVAGVRCEHRPKDFDLLPPRV